MSSSHNHGAFPDDDLLGSASIKSEYSAMTSHSTTVFSISHAACDFNHTVPFAVKPSVKPPVVDISLHAENRARLVAAMKASGEVPAGGYVVLQGGVGETRHETDHEHLFRQESHFHWAFGVREPDCYGSVHVASGRSTLYVPRLPDSYAVWMGAIKPLSWWQGTYGVDEVRYVDELSSSLKEAGATLLYVLHGFNTDGKQYAKPADFAGADAFTMDKKALWPAITELRVRKTAREIELLRYSARVTSEAHIATMQHTVAAMRARVAAAAVAADGAADGAARVPGLKEYQLESLFQHWCYYHGGARHMSYTCICASGHNGSVLHYGHAGEPNSKTIRDGDLCLFDMGCEYHCYGADITTTFPANGKFTDAQKVVYNAVWSAVKAVEDAMAPGVNWKDMHTLAYRHVLTGLTAGGVLRGDIEDMMAVNLGATFMPHGLGHMLGIDTHDVGGYPEGTERPKEAGYASLRTVRGLEAGMYLTVEPGCYFIDCLLDAALADPAKARFIVPEALAVYRGTGGVRIEDDVLVTATGCENLTWAPREIEDVEAACEGRITHADQIRKYK